jgi:hypothetical protein
MPVRASPGMEFAVRETGVGVLAHLRRNPQHHDLTSATTALEGALAPGVTGIDEVRGNGLHDLFKISRDGRYSRLVLRSGDGIANVVAQCWSRTRPQGLTPLSPSSMIIGRGCPSAIPSLDRVVFLAGAAGAFVSVEGCRDTRPSP